MNFTYQKQESTLTLGEICEALASDEINSRVNEDYYVMSARDLMRYAQRREFEQLFALVDRPARPEWAHAS